MGKSIFKPERFFALRDFRFREIFAGANFVWEVIPKIAEFTSGKLLKGRNCRIAKSVLLREGVILGDNVVVGHCVELKNCLIMNNTHIAHLNYIGDSLIGNEVNISGGAILANFRLDQKPVMVRLGKKKIETSLLKFGAVVGDGCRVGVNSVLNPGTILGKNSWVYPLVSVRGIHKTGSVIKSLLL